MRYLLIIDNGRSYSDHRHMPLVCCDTMAQAEAAAAAFSEWHARLVAYMDAADLECFDVELARWIHANPCPMPGVLPWPECDEGDKWMANRDDTVAIIPIPTWAQA